MRHPAPILTLLHRVRAERNDLRGLLAAALEREDVLKAELAVAQCRGTKWRRLAFEAGEGHPAAMDRMLWQAQREEFADLDEIVDDRARNTFPRSIP